MSKDFGGKQYNFLTDLERGAMQDIAADYFTKFPEIVAIVGRARVMKRENTGSGFFTDLQVPSDSPKWRGYSPIGERLYKIDQYDEPLGVILFSKTAIRA